MKFFSKTLGLMLASLALASCGGGGGDGGTFVPQSGTITLAPGTTTLPTNTGNYVPSDAGPNQTEVTVTMRNADGTLGLPGPTDTIFKDGFDTTPALD